MRQDEGLCVARKRALDVTDVLHGIATEVDLDLEVPCEGDAGWFRARRPFLSRM